MNYQCPVCNKAGLPEYTKVHTECPQCNSDLKPFLLLHALPAQNKAKLRVYTGISLSFFAVVLLIFWLIFNEIKIDNQQLSDSNSRLSATNTYLTQSLDSAIIATTDMKQTIENKEITFNYTVKKGDSPYKIAHLFYGDGSKYSRIEADNKLIRPYTLLPGQVLIIKFSQ